MKYILRKLGTNLYWCSVTERFVEDVTLATRYTEGDAFKAKLPRSVSVELVRLIQ